MRSAALAGSFALAALLAAERAFATDVGLINHLAGEVSYTSGASTAKAKAYMNVLEGDRISVASGAQVKLVYFQGGRQESYTGPATFTTGLQQSRLRSGSAPEVTLLPSGVPQQIAQTPELIHIARLGRSGRVALSDALRNLRLTPQQQAEVRQARQTYLQLRASAPADDITPELYMYSVLQDHLLFNDMKVVAAEMQRRQPANADVEVMVAYVNRKTQTR